MGYSRKIIHAGDFLLNIPRCQYMNKEASLSATVWKRLATSDEETSITERQQETLDIISSDSSYIILAGTPLKVGKYDEISSGPLGAYCIAEVNSQKINIQLDSGNLYAVFVDEGNGFISTSLNAILNQNKCKWKIDKLVLSEQILTGSVVGKETPFIGIERLIRDGVMNLDPIVIIYRTEQAENNNSFGRLNHNKLNSIEYCSDYMLSVLRDYFRVIKEFVGDRSVSLGVSGGYDSRLLVLLARDAGLKIQAYTYESPNHVDELRIATDIAQALGLTLRRIPVRLWGDLDLNSLRNNIEDTLLYYDGRTNDTMGTFSDVHTSRIFRQCLGTAYLNLNGIGGELFRNWQTLPPYPTNFDTWFEYFILAPGGERFFKNSIDKWTFYEYIREKYLSILGEKVNSKVNRSFVRKYYKNIWLPYFASPRISAENRVAFSLMPFADSMISSVAISISNIPKWGEEFEALMIRRLSPEVARIPSSYGYSFHGSGVRKKALRWLKTFIPIKVRLLAWKIKEGEQNTCGVEVAPLLHHSIGFIRSLNLPLNIDRILSVPILRDRLLYISTFLYKYKDKLYV